MCRTCSVCCQKRSRRSVPWIRPRPTVCRSALSCKPIALLASGLTGVTHSGTSLNRETWTLHCRRHPPSGMIDRRDTRTFALLCLFVSTPHAFYVFGLAVPMLEQLKFLLD